MKKDKKNLVKNTDNRIFHKIHIFANINCRNHGKQFSAIIEMNTEILI